MSPLSNKNLAKYHILSISLKKILSMVNYGGNRSWVCILMTFKKRYESASMRVCEPEKNRLRIFLSIGSSWRLQKLGVHFDDTRKNM
jgi:hypothetical protein